MQAPHSLAVANGARSTAATGMGRSNVSCIGPARRSGVVARVVAPAGTNSPPAWHKLPLKHVIDSQQFNREALDVIFEEALRMEKVGARIGHASCVIRCAYTFPASLLTHAARRYVQEHVRQRRWMATSCPRFSTSLPRRERLWKVGCVLCALTLSLCGQVEGLQVAHAMVVRATWRGRHVPLCSLLLLKTGAGQGGLSGERGVGELLCQLVITRVLAC